MTFATAAAGYLARGWQPLPLHRPTAAGCSCAAGSTCGSPGKHPLVSWPADQVIDADQVHRWAQRWPLANVGIITGAVSGLLVLDVDPGHGGFESLDLLERRCGLPPTLTARSGSGGLHCYFGHPGLSIGPSAGKLGAGLDIRCDRGLIVAPDSLHHSGQRYSWVEGVSEPAPCPRWLVRALLPTPRASSQNKAVVVSEDMTAFAAAVLERSAEKVRSAAEGEKWYVLWRQAYHLGCFVGAGILTKADAEAALLAALGDRAKSVDAAKRTIASCVKWGQQNPAEVST